jgi:hypothetical protein
VGAPRLLDSVSILGVYNGHGSDADDVTYLVGPLEDVNWFPHAQQYWPNGLSASQSL